MRRIEGVRHEFFKRAYHLISGDGMIRYPLFCLSICPLSMK